MAAEGVSPLGVAGEGAGRTEVGECEVRAHRLPGHRLLLGSQTEAQPDEPGGTGSGDSAHLRKTGHSARGAEAAGGRGGGCGVRQRLRGYHLQREAGRAGNHLLLVLGSGAEPSGPGAEVSGLGGALHRQLLRRAERGGVHRRVFRLCAQGRALPDGAFHLLPHQRGGHRPVRTHADRRRRGRLRQLPRRLHCAHPRREPVARRGGRADRARQRADQVLDGAELVSRATKKAKAESTTS